jgi:hypothetical protein
MHLKKPSFHRTDSSPSWTHKSDSLPNFGVNRLHPHKRISGSHSDENGREHTENLLTVSRPKFFHWKRERERDSREWDGKRDKRVYENEQIWRKIQRKRTKTGTIHRDGTIQTTEAEWQSLVPAPAWLRCTFALVLQAAPQ